MCKILIKALDKPEASVDKSAIKSLQKMRQQFLQNPLPPMEEEPELKANQNNPVVNGLIH